LIEDAAVDVDDDDDDCLVLLVATRFLSYSGLDSAEKELNN